MAAQLLSFHCQLSVIQSADRCSGYVRYLHYGDIDSFFFVELYEVFSSNQCLSSESTFSLENQMLSQGGELKLTIT